MQEKKRTAPFQMWSFDCSLNCSSCSYNWMGHLQSPNNLLSVAGDSLYKCTRIAFRKLHNRLSQKGISLNIFFTVPVACHVHSFVFVSYYSFLDSFFPPSMSFKFVNIFSFLLLLRKSEWQSFQNNVTVSKHSLHKSNTWNVTIDNSSLGLMHIMQYLEFDYDANSCAKFTLWDPEWKRRYEERNTKYTYTIHTCI